MSLFVYRLRIYSSRAGPSSECSLCPPPRAPTFRPCSASYGECRSENRPVSHATTPFRPSSIIGHPSLKQTRPPYSALRIARLEARTEDDAELQPHTHGRMVLVVRVKPLAASVFGPGSGGGGGAFGGASGGGSQGAAARRGAGALHALLFQPAAPALSRLHMGGALGSADVSRLDSAALAHAQVAESNCVLPYDILFLRPPSSPFPFVR